MILQRPLTTSLQDWESFFEYLRSDKGHELATRIVSLFEEIKKATLDRSAEQSARAREIWNHSIAAIH